MKMKGIEVIKKRRNIREYSDKQISDNDLHQILDAGMRGPSCVNAKDWCFLVIKDKAKLSQMAEANGNPAELLKRANIGILVCGDLNRSFKGAPEYWIIDGAIACQNIVLAARSLGIGSVWLGTYPQMDKVNMQKELFHLPEHIMPHSIIALGYPKDKDEMELGCRSVYEESQVHLEEW